jgi:hypothetical protein
LVVIKIKIIIVIIIITPWPSLTITYNTPTPKHTLHILASYVSIQTVLLWHQDHEVQRL